MSRIAMNYVESDTFFGVQAFGWPANIQSGRSIRSGKLTTQLTVVIVRSFLGDYPLATSNIYV